MANDTTGWRWENTGGGVMRWTLGGFVIGGPAGEDPIEGRPCFVSHFANDHEFAVEYPDPDAARQAVTSAMVEMSEEDDPDWIPMSLVEWMAVNEENGNCADAAMQLLRDRDALVYLGGGAAPLFCVRRPYAEG